MRALVPFILVCMAWRDKACHHQHGRVSLNQFRIAASHLFVVAL
jgi:hypothetical protein